MGSETLVQGHAFDFETGRRIIWLAFPRAVNYVYICRRNERPVTWMAEERGTTLTPSNRSPP